MTMLAPDQHSDVRPATRSRLRQQAVENVIRTVRERLDEPVSLPELAEMAWLSPYHFNRVFRRVTGMPPFHFLAALRMEAAKRMLLTTRLSVTDVCFAVGYQSLGTFTSHFSRFVGLPPTRLRSLPLESVCAALESLPSHPPPVAAPHHGLSGRISVQDSFSGPVFVGLFPTPIPQQRPAACCLLSRPDAYHIPHVPDGEYFVFAAAFERSNDPLAYLLPHEGNLRIGVGPGPLTARDGQIVGGANLVLRPPRLIDPPILIALPLLLAEQHGSIRRGLAA